MKIRLFYIITLLLPTKSSFISVLLHTAFLGLKSGKSLKIDEWEGEIAFVGVRGIRLVQEDGALVFIPRRWLVDRPFELKWKIMKCLITLFFLLNIHLSFAQDLPKEIKAIS